MVGILRKYRRVRWLKKNIEIIVIQALKICHGGWLIHCAGWIICWWVSSEWTKEGGWPS